MNDHAFSFRAANFYRPLGPEATDKYAMILYVRFARASLAARRIYARGARQLYDVYRRTMKG